jgi:hypothetical protein
VGRVLNLTVYRLDLRERWVNERRLYLLGAVIVVALFRKCCASRRMKGLSFDETHNLRCWLGRQSSHSNLPCGWLVVSTRSGDCFEKLTSHSLRKIVGSALCASMAPCRPRIWPAARSCLSHRTIDLVRWLVQCAHRQVHDWELGFLEMTFLAQPFNKTESMVEESPVAELC